MAVLLNASGVSNDSSFQMAFKIVLLGEGCVGKTSILLRFVQNKFNEKHLSTLQACFFEKRIVLDGKRVTLNIWDTAGQERFHALGPIYYRDSHAGLLVYDITDEDSFNKVKNWVKELRKIVGPDVLLCIVGNKCDLDKDRHVPLAEAEQYASSIGALHFQTSAKLGKGIDQLFTELSKQLARVQEAAWASEQSRAARANGAGGGSLQIVDDVIASGGAGQQQRTGCCG